MKAIFSLLVIVLWGYMLYRAVKYSKERRLNRYSKFFDKLADSVDEGDSDDANDELQN